MRFLLERPDHWFRDESGRFSKRGKADGEPKPKADVAALIKQRDAAQEEAVWARRMSRHSSQRAAMIDKYHQLMDKVEALTAEIEKIQKAG